MIEPARKANAVEQGAGLLIALLAAEHGREHHVFQCGQLGKQKIGLEHKSHPPVAQEGQLVPPQGEELLPLELHGPGARMFESRQNVEQGGFAGTRGAAQEDDFALRNVEFHATQDFKMTFTEIVGLTEATR